MKYKKNISSKLSVEPARVTPMQLDIDTTKWKTKANRLPSRIQSIVKDEVIKSKIEVMLENGVIINSESSEWSQVLLTPKPGSQWRFCIDFRKLNEATTTQGYPLPRIKEIIQRIGSKKPSLFTKFDLTSGYYQMPLSKHSQQYTAFTSTKGINQWTRVPMGLKNAAAYFQKVMTEEVLSDLVTHICELYIDDCIIWATSEKELLTRMEQVLKRCENRNIIINPAKCMVGFAELEILGHTINSQGITFSQERLAKVADIPIPATGTKLLSFLGLVNYFHEHIRNYTELLTPLRRLAQRYPGSQKFTGWTPEKTEAFSNAKAEILNLQPLYFIDYNSEVYLHTDASNHGIGAYLFQIIEGKERPIAFLSTALHGPQLNWSTFETEGYAIWYALKKFEYLLRDIHFTIRTDHRNLLYVNQTASPKVQRWKWDIQQYNFHVEHIPGRLNVVADGLSRLATLRLHRKERHNDVNEQNDAPSDIKSCTTSETCYMCCASYGLAVSKSLAVLHTTDVIPKRINPLTRSTRQTISDENDSDDEDEITPSSQTPTAASVNGATVQKEREENVYKHPPVRPTPTAGAKRIRAPMTIQSRAIIQAVHNAHMGHHGVERTMNLLQAGPHIQWKGMRADVKQFIRECACCQFMNTLELTQSVAPFNVSAFYPMDRLNIDHIGPLPEDEDGNKFILVIIDVFSRFVELYPTKTTSSIDFAKCLLDHIGRYGHPDEILTDNGGAFISELSQQLFKLADTHHTTTLAYSHEENSIVERANKEVMRHLRAIVFDKNVHSTWSKYKSLVQRIMNTTPKQSTGVSPARVIYGNNIDLDRGIVKGYKQPPIQNMTECIQELTIAQARLIAVAQATQSILNAKHIDKRIGKSRKQPVTHTVNDLVLLAPHRDSVSGKRRRVDKLATAVKGPYRIVNVQGSRYTLQD